MKTFTLVSFVSLVLAVLAATLSLVGTIITGLYPAIGVFCVLVLVPVVSRAYIKKRITSTGSVKKVRISMLTVLNALTILIICWMSFVIVHDRVLGDCC